MTVSDYVEKMAAASKTPQHEVILECLEWFGLYGVKDLTLEQAGEFWSIFYGRG